MTRLLTIVAAMVFTPSIAHAAAFVLEANGTVSHTWYSFDGSNVPAPAGTIQVGDLFKLRVAFSTDLAEPSLSFDPTSTTNIYWLRGADVIISVGSYQTRFTPKFQISASVQLWNDRQIEMSLVDAQSFEFSNYNFSGGTPFELGGGLNSELVSLTSFDFLGQSRTNSTIEHLSPSSIDFGSNSLSYSYSAGGNPLEGPRPMVGVLMSGITWQVSTVPEIAVWVSMISGFGAVGVALRRRNGRTKRSRSDLQGI